MKSAVMERPVSPGMVEQMVTVNCTVVGCGKSLRVLGVAVSAHGEVNPGFTWKRVGEAVTTNQYFYCSDACKERYAGGD